MNKPATIIAVIAGLWIVARTLLAAVTFLALTPTYLDDTLDNWNLRAKMFYFDQSLTLIMPAEDPNASLGGISSYPPTLPLMKTSLAVLAREWNEPLINSIHVIFYFAALSLVFFLLRRLTSTFWALCGAYLLGSMPLFMMHGTNPYADAYMSVHIVMAMGMILLGLREDDTTARAALLRIAAFATGLLPFVKNEGLLLYFPPLILILCLGLLFNIRTGRMTMKEALNVILWFGGFMVLCALPWLIFKWSHGLTFGNAKPFTQLGIGWQDGVVSALIINTFSEGNWLLMFPLLALLLAWRRRAAFKKFGALTAFVLIIILGQWTLYLFTGLSTEARMQTGLARGLVQMLPTITVLVTLLLADASTTLENGFNELARMAKLAMSKLQ
jgi:hypothetical protein